MGRSWGPLGQETQRPPWGHTEGEVRDPSTREGSGMSGLGPMGDWGDMIFPALGQKVIRREGPGLVSLVGKGLGCPSSTAEDHVEGGIAV